METLISKSSRSLVFVDQEKKRIRKEYLLDREINTEINVLKKLKLKGIPQFLESQNINGLENGYFDFFTGISLQKYIVSNELSLDSKLSLVLELCRIIENVHKEGVIHQRINPYNILVNPDTKEVFLHDFGFAVQESTQVVFDLEAWKDDLLFISPEQTGKLGRKIDFYTDLYAIGLCLYFVFFEKIIFDKGDTFDVLKAHLSEKPEVEFGSKNIPLVLQEIIFKLIHKSPNDRYKSVSGLLHDLEYCKNKADDLFTETNFVLGEFDFSPTLMSSVIVQRELLFSDLNEKFEAIKKGAKQKINVYGESGIGKTFLVNEWKKSIVDQDPFWVEIKNQSTESFSKGSAVHQMISNLVKGLMALPNREYKFYKNRVQEFVGDSAIEFVGWIPESKYLFDQKSVSSAEKELTRLSYASMRFFQACMSELKPVVLFCDDFQWVDDWSRNVLVSLFTHVDSHHFFTIINSREKELNSDFEFDATLSPDYLQADAIQELLKQSVSETIDVELGDVVYKKTLGHPFFVGEFINKIYREGFLSFNYQIKKWELDFEAIKAYQTFANVGEYLAVNISALSHDETYILQIVALNGGEISSCILEEIGFENSNVFLQKLLDTHFLILDQNTLRFSHDLVQTQVLVTITKDRKQEIHRAIAVLLQQKTSLEMYPFHALYHSVLCGEISDEKGLFLECVAAGNYYKNASDLEQSNWFFTKANTLFIEQWWKTDYASSLAFFNGFCSTSFILRDYESMHLCEDQIEKFANTQFDKLHLNEILLDCYSASHEFEKTVDYLLKVLGELGFQLTKKPSKIKVIVELIKTQLALRGKKMSDIAALPKMTDKRALAFLKLTEKSATSIFGSAPELLPLIIFNQTQLSLKYGNSVCSPYAYASFGYAMSAFMNKVEKGDEFGRLSVELISTMQGNDVAARTQVIYYAFLAIVCHNWKSSIKPLEEAYEHGMNSGDYFYASFAKYFSLELRFFAGDSLLFLAQKITDAGQIVKGLKQELIFSLTDSLNKLVDHLRSAQGLDYHSFLNNEIKVLEEKSDRASLFNIGVFGMVGHYFSGEMDKAYHYLAICDQYLDPTSPRQTCYSYYLFFKGLISISSFKEGALPKKDMLKNVKSCLKKLAFLAKHHPASYQHKHDLLSVYLSSVLGGAFDGADALIEKSKSSGFRIDEALCSDLYGQYVIETGKESVGKHYLEEASKVYQEWGCLVRVSYLKDKFNVFTKDKETNQLANKLNFETILTINESIVEADSMHDLLKSVCTNLISNAVAHKVVVFLCENEHLVVPRVFADLGEVKMLTNDVLDKDLFSQDLVEECRKKQEVVIDTQNGNTKVCSPIRGKALKGYLYLEAWEEETGVDIRLIASISNQLAISMNSILVTEQRIAFAQKEKNYKQELLNVSLKSQEKERARLAQDLHDGIGSDLAGIKRKLENYDDKLFNGSDNTIAEIKELLDNSCQELRLLSHDLMPPSLQRAGLIAAVKQLANVINIDKTIYCHCVFADWPEYLSRNEELMLYRIIQEAVNNALKYAKTSELFIQLLNNKNELVVMIEDNGVGFDKKVQKNGLGLQSMEMRASALKGRLEISTFVNKGTSIIVSVPLR